MAKEKRFETVQSRWSEGKVHRYIYDSLNRTWHVACREVWQANPHGREVPSDREVTCRKCRP